MEALSWLTLLSALALVLVSRAGSRVIREDQRLVMASLLESRRLLQDVRSALDKGSAARVERKESPVEQAKAYNVIISEMYSPLYGKGSVDMLMNEWISDPLEVQTLRKPRMQVHGKMAEPLEVDWLKENKQRTTLH